MPRTWALSASPTHVARTEEKAVRSVDGDGDFSSKDWGTFGGGAPAAGSKTGVFRSEEDLGGSGCSCHSKNPPRCLDQLLAWPFGRQISTPDGQTSQGRTMKPSHFHKGRWAMAGTTVTLQIPRKPSLPPILYPLVCCCWQLFSFYFLPFHPDQDE